MGTKKLERVLKLLAELLNAESPRTAEELRSKIKMYPEDIVAFRRAFNRDKSALKDMGVPLQMISVGESHKNAEAYFVDNQDYYLPDLNLTENELAELNYAANSVHLLGKLTEEEALRKLGGYWAEAKSKLPGIAIGADAHLTRLFEALTRKSRVTYIYKEAAREVEPYLLQFAGEKWYLTGNVVDEGITKSFRTDRIADLVINNQSGEYSIPKNVKGANLISYTYGDDPEIKAVVKIDPSYVQWVEQNLSVEVDINEDGSGLAEFMVSNYDLFIDRVLLLLDHAEIVQPDSLRSQIVKRLEAMQCESGDNNA